MATKTKRAVKSGTGMLAFVTLASDPTAGPGSNLTERITCSHDKLVKAKKAKRLVSVATWEKLRQRYPDGPTYPVRFLAGLC